MDAQTLVGAGSISRSAAIEKAEGEYTRFRAQLDQEQSDVERTYLRSVKEAQKRIEGKKS